MSWRIGKHYGIHVYEGDRPVATFHDAADAERAVAAVNAAEPTGPATLLLVPRPPAQDPEDTVEEVLAALRDFVQKADAGAGDLLVLRPAQAALLVGGEDATCGDVYDYPGNGRHVCALPKGHATDHAERPFDDDGNLPRGTFVWAR